jgi:hypothetical protein
MFNRESEAVEARWMGIPADGDAIVAETLELSDVVAKVGLAEGLVNAGKAVERREALQALVPGVIASAKERLVQGRTQRVKETVLKRARAETRRLETWVAESLRLLDEQTASWTQRGARVPRHIETRLSHEREHIEKVRLNHRQLLESIQSRGEPYLRLAAVFAGA